MNATPVRVRFAPRPHDPLHLVSARTALFAWLYARHHDGAFILRLEDTDTADEATGAAADVVQDLRWLGLNWDEGPEVGGEYGPYRQHERMEIYHHWAEWLVAQGRAYVNEKEPTIRFRLNRDTVTRLQDELRGWVSFGAESLSDPVLISAEGLPTHHLARVVDDHLMAVTHVFQAEEWLPLAPIYCQIMDAFGWERPQFVHLPAVLNPGGSGRLSQHRAQFMYQDRPVDVVVPALRKAGFMPQGVANLLLLVGWGYGHQQEVFTLAEAAPRFRVGDIKQGGAAYPVHKLSWLSGMHIRRLEVEELAALLSPFIEAHGYQVDTNKLVGIVPAIQTRIRTLHDGVKFTGFLWDPDFKPGPADAMIPKGLDGPRTLALLTAVYDLLEDIQPFAADTLEHALRNIIQQEGLRTAQLLDPIRVAITAQPVAPPLFAAMQVLGRAETRQRLAASLEVLQEFINRGSLH
ncbi:MAG: glutamate--tRNA ligase [Chloroflexi bacterium]|nr:glutamate--tRNA ligase [Chloroflexota bacterium]